MRRVSFVLAAVLLFSAADMYGQALMGVSGRNLWNDGSNMAGMRQDTSCPEVSFAEVNGGVKGGNFKASFEAPFCWNNGAKVATVMHMKKFSFRGTLSYDRMQGNQMKASMIITPGYYPIDIDEFTAGKKVRHEIALKGGLGVDLGASVRAGLLVDLVNVNYSKFEDLCYDNHGMDFKASPSLMWHSDRWSFGANYIFASRSENPVVSQKNSPVAPYEVFLDKGLFFGHQAAWTDPDIKLNADGALPIREYLNGFALQIERGSSVYADFEYTRGNGTVGGVKDPWMKFPSHNFVFRLTDRFESANFKHTVRMTVNARNLRSIEYDSVPGGEQMFSRKNASLRLSYVLSAGKWDLDFTGGLSEMAAVSTQFNPFVVETDLGMWNMAVTPKFHFKSVDLFVGVKYGQGIYDEEYLRRDVNETVDFRPERLDSYFVRYREYMESPYLQPNIMVKYKFAKGVYAALDASLQKAFNIEFLAGSIRYGAGLKVGYDF